MTQYLLFGSPTCMPCKTIKSILPSLGFEFEYVDVFEHPELAGEHLIMSTPTMIKFEDSVKVATAIGQGDIMAFVSKEQE